MRWVSLSSDFPRAARIPLRVPRQSPRRSLATVAQWGLFVSTLSGGKLQNHESPVNSKMRIVLCDYTVQVCGITEVATVSDTAGKYS